MMTFSLTAISQSSDSLGCITSGMKYRLCRVSIHNRSTYFVCFDRVQSESMLWHPRLYFRLIVNNFLVNSYRLCRKCKRGRHKIGSGSTRPNTIHLDRNLLKSMQKSCFRHFPTELRNASTVARVGEVIDREIAIWIRTFSFVRFGQYCLPCNSAPQRTYFTPFVLTRLNYCNSILIGLSLPESEYASASVCRPPRSQSAKSHIFHHIREIHSSGSLSSK